MENPGGHYRVSNRNDYPHRARPRHARAHERLGVSGGAEGKTLWAVLGGIFVANGIPEAIAAGVLTTLVVAARLGFSSSRRKSKLSSEEYEKAGSH